MKDKYLIIFPDGSVASTNQVLDIDVQYYKDGHISTIVNVENMTLLVNSGWVPVPSGGSPKVIE